MDGFWGAVMAWSPSLVGAVAFFIVGHTASKLSQRITLRACRTRRLDELLSRYISEFVRWAVLAAAVIAALQTVGVETTSFVALLGVAGLAVGMALQGNLSNFASGVMLLTVRPFELDDVVIAGGHTGGVEDIGLFATTLVTLDNQKIIVPNSAITSGSIVNLTTKGTRRAEIAVGVAYGVDVNQVRSILITAMKAQDYVLASPEPDVVVVNLGASSVDLLARAWVTAGDLGPKTPALRQLVYDTLNEQNVEIPYAQLVVHKAPAQG